MTPPLQLAPGLPGDPPSVLLVDDNWDYRRVLRRLLEQAGLDVLDCGSGLAALTLLERVKVGVVVADLMMPGMDGRQLLEEVGRRWPDTSRLLLTGRGDGALVVGADYRVIGKSLANWLIIGTIAELATRQP